MTMAETPPIGPRSIPVRNDSSYEVPAWGVMRVTGVVMSGELAVVKIDRPDGTTGPHLVNGPIAIAAGGFGRGSVEVVNQVLYDTGTPAVGDGYTPKTGTFTLTAGAGAFTCFGIIDAASKRGAFAQSGGSGVRMFRGKLVGTLAVATASQTVTPEYAYSGDLPTGTPTAYNIFGLAGIVDTKVVCVWNPGLNQWEITQAQHKSVDLQTSYSIDGPNKKFKKDVRTFAEMYSDATTTTTDVHTGDVCP